MGLPAFLVTDHERVYRLSFWAKATGNPKPRPHITFQARVRVSVRVRVRVGVGFGLGLEPHITFQDEDNNYEYIYGDFVQLSAFWHQYHVDLVVPFKLRGYISPASPLHLPCISPISPHISPASPPGTT